MIRNDKKGGFGGHSFGLPEITVDWEGIEEAKDSLQEKIDAQKAENANKSVISETQNNLARLNRLTMAGSSIGFAGGVAYAFKKKTGFWKGFGYALIGSITLGSLTRGVGFLTTKK